MPSSSRSGFVVAFAAALALAGCASGGPAPRGCQASDECPTGTRCVSGACVANAAPLPVIGAPAALEAHALHAFDAAGSSDPDADDSVVSWAWEFRAVDAPCAPPVAAETLPSAVVRFGCPGAYEVALTVADEMGAASTATRALTVAARAGTPLVMVGPDVSLDHLCEGTPLRCAPAGAVAVSAYAPDFAPGELTWSWTVEAPADRPLGAGRRVTFSPGPAVPSPAVAIETDGEAISGHWIFRVEARDAAGVVGAESVRVTVLNRLPVVTEAVPTFAHVFDPVRSEFRVSQVIGVEAVDPDGDPLVDRAVSGNHSGDGGAAFAVEDVGSGLAVAVTVPYAQPADAAYLIGAPGLERSVTFTIRDVNGAFVSETWSVVVANRPPAPVSPPLVVDVDHAFDEVAGAYTARATLATWADPDGDPLFPAGPTGNATCPTLSVEAGAARVDCSMAYVGAPSVAAFARTHALSYAIRDPWVTSPALGTSVRIGNRSPRVVLTTAGPQAECLVSEVCCDWDVELGCYAYEYSSSPTEFGLVGFVADDDGDPVELLTWGARATVTPTQAVCLPADCAVHVSDPGTIGCGQPRYDLIGFTVRDGGPEVVGNVSYGGCS